MFISVAIPFINQHEVTKHCIDTLYKNASDPFELILIDNASDYLFSPPVDKDIKYIKNETNIGCFPSLKQVMDITNGDIVIFMHNDVLIHQKGWDHIIRDEFVKDEKLALAGFFGAPGVDRNGGRIGSHSNMQGREWGSAWGAHGYLLEETHPAVVLDSLVMIFRKSLFKEIEIDDLPPHHWFDRIIPLRFINKDYHVATIGVEFDHAGGTTSTTMSMEDFCRKWCEERDIPPLNGSYDLAVYSYGAELFYQYNRQLPRYVDAWYRYR